MQMPPGSAMPSSRAATLTPSPRMSSPSIRMSPRLIPILKQHTPVLRDTFVPLGHHRLHSHRALDRIDHRGKLKQHAVPRGLHEATAVLRHEGIGNLAVFAEGAGGADLVEAHEPRVARHVSRDYRRQPASDPSWLLLLHGQAAPAAPSCPDAACRQSGLREVRRQQMEPLAPGEVHLWPCCCPEAHWHRLCSTPECAASASQNRPAQRLPMANSYLLETLRGTAAVNRLQIATLIGSLSRSVELLTVDIEHEENTGGSSRLVGPNVSGVGAEPEGAKG